MFLTILLNSCLIVQGIDITIYLTICHWMDVQVVSCYCIITISATIKILVKYAYIHMLRINA